MVGQFAVAQGRHQFERRFGPGAAVGGGSNPPEASGDQAHEPYESAPAPEPEPDAGQSTVASPAEGGRSTSAEEAEPSHIWSQDSQSPAAGRLAIPGYDSLSAYQVVQRLAGLSSDELAAVGDYESAHRARQTVLARVRQLQRGE
jgi:hypothetical protein